MGGRALGRNWLFSIDVGDVDPQHRWIDLVVHLPFGIQNYEHLTLTETREGGTLVRFN
jgi:ligand-binding SRPBCC domain-containing protein